MLTVEIEHVDAVTLEKLELLGIDCQSKASTIRIIQVSLAFFLFACLLRIVIRVIAFVGTISMIGFVLDQLFHLSTLLFSE